MNAAMEIMLVMRMQTAPTLVGAVWIYWGRKVMPRYIIKLAYEL